MELRHIRYFLMVANELNFTRAAARLGIGQPPLSQQVRDMERELGVKLLQRRAYGVELTEAGKAFLDKIRCVPDIVQRAAEIARHVAAGDCGMIRVGFTGSTAFHPLVTGTIRTFRDQYPKVEMTLKEANSTELIAAILERKLDIAFIRPPPTPVPALRVSVLASEPMVAVLPQAHPLSRKKILNLKDMRHESFILTPHEVGPLPVNTIIDACKKVGFEMRRAQTAPQIGSIVNLVAAGLGVSVIPSCMQALKVPGVTYRHLHDIQPEITLAVACIFDNSARTVENFSNLFKHLLASIDHL